MFNRSVAAVGLAASLLQPASSARAFGPSPMMMAGGPGILHPMLLRGIGLTAEQERQIEAIRDGNIDSVHPLLQQLRAAHEALETKLLSAEDVDEADLEAEINRIGELRAQLLDLEVETARSIRALLTSEQLASAAERQARMRAFEPELDVMFIERAD